MCQVLREYVISHMNELCDTFVLNDMRHDLFVINYMRHDLLYETDIWLVHIRVDSFICTICLI